MARLVPLTRDKFAVVDQDDWYRVKHHKWRYMTNGYAAKEDDKQSVLLHHEIVWCPEGFEVDHINGDKLDNRKQNLRVCTRAQNQANVGVTSRNKSGFKGVSFDRGKWVARTKGVHLGRFTDPVEAARAYDKKAIELFGEFANLNFKD